MINAWRPLALLSFLLLISCRSYPPAAALEADSGSIATHGWSYCGHAGLELRFGPYRLFTTLDEAPDRFMLARLLQASYAQFTRLAPPPPAPLDLECYVFGERSEWESFTREKTGENAAIYLQITAGGYCQEGRFVGYDLGREMTQSVIAHEAWHQYSWFAFKDRLPSWLEEGLATQQESLQWPSGSLWPVFTPMENQRRRLALRSGLRDGRLWPLRDLLATHAGRVIRHPQRHVDTYYAQLWALTLFLQECYPRELAHLLADAREGKLSAHLRQTNVTTADILSYSEYWNQEAGPIYMIRYVDADLKGLEERYRGFAETLARR